MGPIFNIFKFMNSAATICEQWFLSLHSKFMWFYCSCVEKKKKIQNAEIETRKMRNPNRYYVFLKNAIKYFEYNNHELSPSHTYNIIVIL